MSLPDPRDVPLLKVKDLVGLVPGMGRSALYAALQRGDLPCIRLGGRAFIPTAALRRAWGLDTGSPDSSEGRPAGQPLALTHQDGTGPDDTEDATLRLA